MKELCIDISTWQSFSKNDYQDIANNCKYVIIRAGFGDSDVDNKFEEHYDELSKRNVHLGAYWYSYAQSPEQARTEARLFLSIINGKKFDLPIYLDIEDGSMSGLGRSTLDAIVRAFGEEIQNAGYYFGVYSNLNWYKNILSGSELNKSYDWWIALWDNTPPDPDYGINYGIWQFGSTWIGGQNVDGNYIYKDYPTIIRELGLNHLDDPTPPTPTPTHKIEEDGLWGKCTTELAQIVFKSGLVDGVVSNQLIWWKNQNPALLDSTFEWQDSMNGGSPLIRCIQEWCGAEVDGYIGSNTISCMQRKLNCEVIDGFCSYPSAMVKAFQHWLNQQ